MVLPNKPSEVDDSASKNNNNNNFINAILTMIARVKSKCGYKVQLRIQEIRPQTEDWSVNFGKSFFHDS